MTTDQSCFVPELVPRGVYHVGDRVFHSKIQALIYAQANNLHPHWDFHDQWFSKFDWSKEPSQPLDYFYTLRCHQLRDEYDYLVLHYSGGSDSHNMLTFFYKNAIHVDEIIIALPITYYEKHTSMSNSREARDSHNEWFHVIKPDIKWITENLPKTKLTLYDYTVDMINFDVDQDWILHAGEHINPNITNRINRYYRVESIDIYDKHKVGHVYGIDKPLVFQHQDHWYLAFLDSMLSIQSSSKPVFDKHDHVHVEYFYWTPNLPELLIKQAHLVKSYYEHHPDLVYLASFKHKSPSNKEMERNLSRSVVYPYWRQNTFQTQKASNSFFKEFDLWFFDHATESSRARWYEGFNFLTNNIQSRWLNLDAQNRPSGLVGFYSKWHRLD